MADRASRVECGCAERLRPGGIAVKQPRIIGPSEHLPDKRRASQRSVNMYPTRGEGAGEDRNLMMASVPGLAVHHTFADTIRGTLNASGQWFTVAGQTLYEYVSGSWVSRGTGIVGLDRVSMEVGRDQLCIVTGPEGYVYSLGTSTLSSIGDADWLGSDDVGWLDGYFLFADPGTDQTYISAIDDASDLDALDFTSADSHPDDVTAFRVHKRQIYYFGQRSTEIWVDSGGADYPFTRYSVTPIDIGVVGKRALCKTPDSLYFVGQDQSGTGYVYELNSYQPQRISTVAVETALQSATLSDLRMWTYKAAGAEFVAVDAPGMTTSWVFDVSTRLWHERGEMVNGEWTRCRLVDVVSYGQDHYGYSGSVMYKLTGTSLPSADHVRERTMPHLVSPSLEPISYHCLELACQTGTDGVVTLELSNDGGNTFGPPLLRSLGVTGRSMQRVRWMPLGTSYDRVFRIRCSTDTDFTIYSGNLE